MPQGMASNGKVSYSGTNLDSALTMLMAVYMYGEEAVRDTKQIALGNMTAALLNDPLVVSELIKEEEAKVKVLIDKYSRKMKGLHLGGRVKQMAGRSGEAIIAAANQEGAGLIVMGSRGMGKVRRTLIGSVSDYVLHHAHIPVLICRKPQPQESHQ
ncbi:universal stress protein MJ0531 [Elysia marginata]|uniref:Universal stress protein MJ0531 n=1 Tax=Elysia marginata TaxID=1093978 RepID=A0AAV4HDM1_9GAST|nr:universal stress protein MJ0531 [Elysia marginata]